MLSSHDALQVDRNFKSSFSASSRQVGNSHHPHTPTLTHVSHPPNYHRHALPSFPAHFPHLRWNIVDSPPSPFESTPFVDHGPNTHRSGDPSGQNMTTRHVYDPPANHSQTSTPIPTHSTPPSNYDDGRPNPSFPAPIRRFLPHMRF